MKKQDKFQRNVFVTTDFDKFKFFEINREASIRPELIEDMKKYGRFFMPIIVDKEFNVYDGQHRLLVAEKLNKPIEYIIDEGITADDIARLNTSSKNWSIEDFIRSYARQGLVDYQALERLEDNSMSKQVSRSVVRAVALNKMQSGSNSQVIKDGEFKFYNYGKTVETIELLNSFLAANRGKSIKEKLGNAIHRLTKVPNFDKDRLLKVAANPSNTYFTEYAYGTVNDALKDLIDEYNRGLRNEDRMIDYAITNSNKFVFADGLIEWSETELEGAVNNG